MKAIAPEKRRELVKSMRQKVSLLDELTKQYWGYGLFRTVSNPMIVLLCVFMGVFF